MTEELVIVNRVINGVLVSMQVLPETRDKWEKQGLLAGETVIAEPELEPEAEPELEPEAEPELEPEAEPELEPEAEPVPAPETGKKPARGKKAANEAAEAGE